MPPGSVLDMIDTLGRESDGAFNNPDADTPMRTAGGQQDPVVPSPWSVEQGPGPEALTRPTGLADLTAPATPDYCWPADVPVPGGFPEPWPEPSSSQSARSSVVASTLSNPFRSPQEFRKMLDRPIVPGRSSPTRVSIPNLRPFDPLASFRGIVSRVLPRSDDTRKAPFPELTQPTWRPEPSETSPPPSYNPVPIPPGVSLAQNAETAEHHKRDLFWFANTVKEHGPWDYKRLDRQYEDFGNFNYGAASSRHRIDGERSLRGGPRRSLLRRPGVQGRQGGTPCRTVEQRLNSLHKGNGTESLQGRKRRHLPWPE